jgi:hypothetical protein
MNDRNEPDGRGAASPGRARSAGPDRGPETTPPLLTFSDTPNAERYVLEADAMRRRQLRSALLHGSRRTWREHARAWPAVVVGLVVVAVIMAALAVSQAFQKTEQNERQQQEQQQQQLEQRQQQDQVPVSPSPGS